MDQLFNNCISINERIKSAQSDRNNIVALESAVITHGLPFPQNLSLALDMENTIIQNGAVPATIGFRNGRLKVGLSKPEIQQMAESKHIMKVSGKDFATASISNVFGGTTVAATLIAAHMSNLKVFVTGGIGGVHRDDPYDESADLIELSRRPLIVVCAGPKAILDIRATREKLETYSVPIVGYQTEFMPAFYSRSSDQKVDYVANSIQDIVQFSKAHWNFGFTSSILVTVPLPAESEIKFQFIETIITEAVNEAVTQDITGPKLTPFLLSTLTEKTGGKTLESNLALLKNNALIGAQIANELFK